MKVRDLLDCITCDLYITYGEDPNTSGAFEIVLHANCPEDKKVLSEFILDHEVHLLTASDDAVYVSLFLARRTMTNEEAINLISRNADVFRYDEDTKQALALAVNALKARHTGHWIIIDDCEHFIAKCSECGRIVDSRMIKKYPYCCCGADMRNTEPQTE